MVRIAFLAVAQAHQYLHWLPAALELSKRRGVRVHVLCPSWAGLRFIRKYDRKGRLRLIWTPVQREKIGLFDLPRRRIFHQKYDWLLRRYRVVVTTETTSTRLRRDPKFRAKLIRIRHGAGDTATRVDDERLRDFDLSLVAGEKDKERLVAAGLATDANCIVTGYAKFELVPPPPKLFADDKPVVLYNAHAREDLTSWHLLGEALIREMERLTKWNFVVAPHVKLDVAEIESSAPNLLIDPGSERSTDMSYTQAASVYLGDASSQVYEFLVRPRPCIFVNAHGVDWRGDQAYAHFGLGQVIERAEELGPALRRAFELQPQFEPLQREAMRRSIDESPVPASVRQADAIVTFLKKSDLLKR